VGEKLAEALNANCVQRNRAVATFFSGSPGSIEIERTKKKTKRRQSDIKWMAVQAPKLKSGIQGIR
jgi:hypothetical protein